MEGEISGEAHKAVGPVKGEPEHARMQDRLMSELKREYATARIVCEENFVDVTVETDDELIFYEIKSDLAPGAVLRRAVEHFSNTPSTRESEPAMQPA